MTKYTVEAKASHETVKDIRLETVVTKSRKQAAERASNLIKKLFKNSPATSCTTTVGRE